MAKTRYGHCDSCGAPIAPGSRSCSHCGGHLRAPVVGVGKDVSSMRLAAGICALFLGSIGVHKFILGQIGSGIILMLLGFVTCFTVSSVIGVAEGIIILTKTDEEFEEIYLIGRRPWF